MAVQASTAAKMFKFHNLQCRLQLTDGGMDMVSEAVEGVEKNIEKKDCKVTLSLLFTNWVNNGLFAVN